MIKMIKINKTYGQDDTKTIAINDIDLQIASGEFVSIMGPSGCGKSTLLNIIGCMDKLSKGELYIDNKCISKCNEKELSLIRNKTVSFIFQNFALMNDYSVYENVELPLLHRKISSREKKEIILNQLQELGIGHLAYKKPNRISGGQQQRVAIARALVSESKVILADEPTGGATRCNMKSIA